VDEAAADATLVEQMALVRQIVTQGHSARASSNIKVRQPLASAFVHLESPVELGDELIELAQDELNVKRVEVVEAIGDLFTYRLLPNNKVLGPRFGRRFPAVRAALAELDAGAVLRRLEANLPIQLEVDGEAVELAGEDILVQTNPREGLAVASDRGVTVGIDTVLTSELFTEGLARDVIRRVQNLRKAAGFNLDDRIITTYQADETLASAIEAWRETIASETLSVALDAGEPDAQATVGEDRIDGHPITLGVWRVS
jgi:isoleucyl-tRNA synthetase